jgi:hypothetical protein
LARPGGSSAFHFHCSQRAELVNEPSFSAKLAAGSRNTSVSISPAGLPPSSLGACQKVAVSTSVFSTITSHFSLESAATILGELGPVPTGFMPKETSPSGPGSSPPATFFFPRYMASNMYIQE